MMVLKYHVQKLMHVAIPLIIQIFTRTFTAYRIFIVVFTALDALACLVSSVPFLPAYAVIVVLVKFLIF